MTKGQDLLTYRFESIESLMATLYRVNTIAASPMSRTDYAECLIRPDSVEAVIDLREDD